MILVSLLTAPFFIQPKAQSSSVSTHNVALLVVDHQVGLFQMTRDMQPDLFKNNIIATRRHWKSLQLANHLDYQL